MRTSWSYQDGRVTDPPRTGALAWLGPCRGRGQRSPAGPGRHWGGGGWAGPRSPQLPSAPSVGGPHSGASEPWFPGWSHREACVVLQLGPCPQSPCGAVTQASPSRDRPICPRPNPPFQTRGPAAKGTLPPGPHLSACASWALHPVCRSHIGRSPVF